MYFWVDGVHSNIRLVEDRQCILVVMGATQDGIAIADGYRESAQSWKGILLDLKERGLEEAPKVAVGDGALRFWRTLREVFPKTRAQRCWVHKAANVLNKLSKHKRPTVKSDLQDIWMAETHADAIKAFDSCVGKCEAKYPKAWTDRSSFATSSMEFSSKMEVALKTTRDQFAIRNSCTYPESLT